MEVDASMARIDRKSSIESEPRTLCFDQIQYAREAAKYVVNTRSMEEAMNIFTEGLKPVGSSVCKSNNKEEDLIMEDYEIIDKEENQIQIQEIIRCSVSAPF